ncbi:hypothetical protein KL920_003942 [Ogataea angusta]|nr:hypothetical protein KL920_003942 [Ogataea angusta]
MHCRAREERQFPVWEIRSRPARTPERRSRRRRSSSMWQWYRITGNAIPVTSRKLERKRPKSTTSPVAPSSASSRYESYSEA